MSLSLDNVFSLFGINSINKSDDDKNENIPVNSFNTTSENSELLSYYSKLVKVSKTINSMLSYFSKGEFNLLSSVLTVDFYNSLSVELNNIKYETDDDYENMRKSIIFSLQGLQQSINQYSGILNLQEENSFLLQQNSILHDREKLNQYMNQLLGERTLFPDQTFTVIGATLRPEYAMYIQLYGFPEGGIFDVEKLATIIQILGIS